MPIAFRKPSQSQKLKRTLRLEITAALLFKVAALAVIYVAFFGPPHRVEVTAARVAQIILNSLPPNPGN